MAKSSHVIVFSLTRTLCELLKYMAAHSAIATFPNGNTYKLYEFVYPIHYIFLFLCTYTFRQKSFSIIGFSIHVDSAIIILRLLLRRKLTKVTKIFQSKHFRKVRRN